MKNTAVTARPKTRRFRQLISAILGGVLAVGAVLVAPVGAFAAPGDLIVQVEYIDGITNEPITDLQAAVADSGVSTEWFYKLNITYSCGPVQCPSANVKIAPQELDPYYNNYRFAYYTGTSLPGNVVTSNAANGETVQLGNLAPGTSGSFQMTYRYQGRGVGADPASFFPEGHQIDTSVTMSATGLDPVTATDAITWHIATPAPRTLVTSPDLARTESNFTYTLYMSASCQWERSTAGHGEPSYECAGSYTVTDQLAPGAVFVSASNGGTYNAATNSVSWTVTGREAAIGWGPMNNTGSPRTVTVNYPDSIVTGDSCVADVANTLNVEMTYLSGVKKTATSTRTHRLNACEPFASAVLDGKSSTRDAGTAADPLVWERQTGNYWNVRLANRANVPGVATIVDNQLGQAGLPVTSIALVGTRGDITYTLDNNTPGSAVNVTSVSAPAGRHIIAATVVTAPLNGPNLEESSQTARTQIDVRYYYTVADDVPNAGWVRTNTATATMSYPDTDLPVLDLGSTSATVTAVPRPVYFRPSLSAAVTGGGQPVVGTPVTYSLNASTADVEPGTPFEGQFVFVAPMGWEILPGTAAVAGATNFTFEYKTATISGQQRQVVYAHRAAGTRWGANETWPTMTVQATPTTAVTGGSTGQAIFYMGDAGHNYNANTAIWGNNGNFRYVDAADLDGDGVTTESYAYVTANVTVGATTALNVLKEICYPNASLPGGCEWQSNPDVPVAVSPTTDDITYRVTITNNGTTAQTGVVAYDVLPHVGDTGLTATSAATPRGSTFAESLASAQAGTGVSLTYSDATNPCRPEVFPAGPVGCVAGWTADADGAMALKAQVAGTLAAGQSRSFTYTTAVEGNPVNGDIACNSVAIDSATTAPNEPRAVCAQIVEADLAVTAPDRLPLQVDRPGTVPFTVTNFGGAATAPAEVTIQVPAELTVSSLEFDGWVCTSEDGEAPIEGGTTLTCAPESGVVTTATPLTLNLPVVPAEGADGAVCVDASVAGGYYDGVPTNNATQACFQIVAGEPELSLTKDDGRDAVEIGDEYSYTITVNNQLVGEAVTGATVTDELPASLAFVSATADGAVTGQNADGSGGTVTWNLADLAPAAAPGADGTAGTPADGSSAVVTVTVRVVQSAENVAEISNTATVTAVDPASDGELSASDTDTDDTVRTAALSLVKTVSPTTVPTAGSEVEYSFLVTNSGDVTLDAVSITEETFTGSGDAPEVICPTGPLAPEAAVTCTATYTVTQEDVEAGGVSNSATATGTAPEGLDAPESDVSTADFSIASAPGIALVKSVGPEVVANEGDTVTYLFDITNTGNRVLEDITVDEISFTGTGDEIIVDCPAEPLAPGASVTCEAEYEVTQADINSGRIDNTAVAAGTTADDEDVTSPESSAAVVIGAAPGITVVKSASSGDLEAGQDVTYSFVVSNVGNVTLTDITIDETAFTGSGDLPDVVCAEGASSIDPGEQVICSTDYTITQADVDAGTVDNTATATGTSPSGTITSDPSSVRLPFEAAPALSVVKSADVEQFVSAGESIEYRFLVTNTGNVTMSDIAIDEGEFSGAGELGEITCASAALLPGEQVLCTAEYETTLADVDSGELSNAATASGLAPAAEERTTSEVSEVITPFAGVVALSLSKAGTPVDVDSDGKVTVADRIQWTFVVTNTGASTLREVNVSDPMAGTVVCDSEELAPGASTECAATNEYQITAAQATAGEVVNVATASATGVGAAVVSSAEAQAIIEVGVVIPPNPDGDLATTGGDSRIAVLLSLFALLIGAGVFAGARSRRQQINRA